MLSTAAAFAALLLTTPPLLGQEGGIEYAGRGEPPYEVTLLPPGSIVLDGRIDESAWAAISPLPAVTHVPSFLAPPSERTEFRIAYDSEYLYFGCHAYDEDPEGIRAYSLERDESGFRSDFCSIYIDTLNDEENVVSFRVGPTGNLADSQRSNDGQQNNASWDTFWDAATSIDADGWHAEFRIPFSSMLFQEVGGEVVMGVSMLRNISRKSETHVFPAIPPDRGTFSYATASRMRKIVFRDLGPQGKPIYITPYSLTGAGYSHALNAARTEYDRSSNTVGEAGLDLRFGVTSNLSLQLTANTDFAQVEADDQQVNLTRFSLFFPEKRDFFQERASNFEYHLGGQDRLFHSRTIGLVQGEAVRLYGGGRLVGRIGEWDVGILDMQTGTSTNLPSENFGVVRLRRRVLNSNSYVGGIVTSRTGQPERGNFVYGVDGIFRVVGDDYLIVNWAQSFDQGEFGHPWERTVARLNWERRRVQGLGYVLDVSRTGRFFDPRMGYVRRRDVTSAQAGIGYGWRSPPGALLNTFNVRVDGALFRRNEDGSVESAEVTPNATLATWGQHQLSLSIPFQYESVPVEFSLPEGTFVPPGIYRFVTPRLQYTAPQGDRFRTTASVEAGRFYDGRRLTLAVNPIFDPSAHLNLSASYQLDLATFDDRGQSFTTHIARLRSQVMLSTRTSAVGFVQYSSAGDRIIANLRFRYSPRTGNDFYLVWNEGLVTDRHSLDPVAPWSAERTVLMKYSHTFRLDM